MNIAIDHNATRSHGVSPRAFFEGIAVIAVVLLLPMMMYLGQAAVYGRVLYPVTNFVLAAYLFAHRSPWYAGQCLLLFCFVSLIRRLVDEQAGWDPSNPVLLTPYLCCLLTVVSFVDYWAGRTPRYLGAFIVVLLCVAYGTVLAVLDGRTFSALVDALKWSIGPLFAVYVLSRREQQADIRRVVENCLVWAGAFMGAYGIFQYLDPPVWDVEWVRGATDLGMTSIGQAEPFGLRVFSTMNSPGSFGAFMSAGIVVALTRGVPASMFGVAFMTMGLALCQYRTLWAATALAVLVVIVSRPTVLRSTKMPMLLLVCVALCSTAAAMPRIREAIVQRAASLVQLKHDQSLASRLNQYDALVRGGDGLILGAGLAIGAMSRRLDGHPPVVIDSGLIEIWRAMGVVVGTVFIIGLGALVIALFGGDASLSRPLAFDRAVVLTTFIQLPMGSIHVGELGFCAWLFLGLGLALLPAGDRLSMQSAATI